MPWKFRMLIRCGGHRRDAAFVGTKMLQTGRSTIFEYGSPKVGPRGLNCRPSDSLLQHSGMRPRDPVKDLSMVQDDLTGCYSDRLQIGSH